MIAGLYPFTARWHAQGTLWIISDTHFGDEELARGIAGRPTDEELVKMINSKVGRKDTLIHLGDVGDLDHMKKVRGYKILITGNHDAGHTNYKEIFDEIYTGALIISEKLILSHEPIDVPWAFNIHGHDHAGTRRKNHLNVCCDVCGYLPVNMNQFMKSGALAHIETIHRDTIDKATIRKQKRDRRKIGGSM